MKFQEGRTLDKIRLKQGAFQPKKAAALLIPLLSALDHAHSQEVLHRDIKPENIIVDDTGVPYLMDFGIAKLMGENETKKLTAKGTTVGTPSYMPPEQAQGKKLTPSCDVYSMGAVLYEMLANQCPYTGSNAVEIMKNVVHQPLKSLASYGNFPQEIIWICETALEKNPQARFQLAKEMEMTLQAFVDGKSLIAIKTIVPDRSSYSQNRNRLSGPQRSASRMTAAGRSGTRSSLSRKTGDSEPKKSPILPILFSLLVIGILAGTLFYLSQSNSPPEGTEVSSSTIAKPPNPIAENPSQDPPKDPSKGVRTASTPSDTLSEEEERMIQGFFSLGKVAEQDRDYAKARDYYDNILSDLKKILSQPKKHPYFPLAYVRYCVAHYELGFVSETEAALDRHLIEYPKDWEAQLLKIKCLRNKRNSLSIIRQIGEMESYFPERTKEILLMKGEAYEELANKPDGNPQDIDQAIQTYNILLSKDDENVEVLTRLGNLYLKNNQTPGDFAKVVEYYTRAGEISKKQGELSPTIQGNLGLAYLFSQRIDEGVALLQNVLKGEQKLDEETRIRFLKYLLQF
jgi:serine/threonine protein kinase/tetratricopeptide (TPR) repeat protein